MTASLSTEPLSRRPCIGLGMQSDCYIYDDVNRQFGVDDDDYARWERRLTSLRPALARIFVPTTDFNPSNDGKTYDWQTVAMRRQYRNLAVLQRAGARVNVCLGPWTNRQMTQAGAERMAVDLAAHLVAEGGFDHIHWLTLFNEPDAIYTTDTPLARSLEARGFGGGLPFADYVEKHRRTLALLAARGLDRQVRLVVGDAMWPPKRRLEWLQLLAAAFGPEPVSYSFHHYAPDDDSFFDHPDAKPFQPPPLADEMRGYREAVGPDAELVCWEFNQPGRSMGTAWPGVGVHGEDHLGTFETAIAHSRKTLSMLAHGIDGACHWCAGDMFYRSGLQQGVMYYGLWRYKWQGWVPRPVYFYYAALIDAFRPGAGLRSVTGLPDGVVGLAARHAQRNCVALLNTGQTTATLRWATTAGEDLARLRISRDRLPRRPDISARETGAEELPLSDWLPLRAAAQYCELQLTTGELTLLKTADGV